MLFLNGITWRRATAKYFDFKNIEALIQINYSTSYT